MTSKKGQGDKTKTLSKSKGKLGAVQEKKEHCLTDQTKNQHRIGVREATCFLTGKDTCTRPEAVKGEGKNQCRMALRPTGGIKKWGTRRPGAERKREKSNLGG